MVVPGPVYLPVSALIRRVHGAFVDDHDAVAVVQAIERTVERRTRRTEEYGEVRRHVAIENGDGEAVASCGSRTMNACS